ncbi:hypothetical protein STEG23_032137 [Scotinomys teguina]
MALSVECLICKHEDLGLSPQNLHLKAERLVVQKTPLTLQTIIVSLGCFLEVKVKSLLPKTPCTSDTGPVAPELELTREPPPCGPVFMVTEGVTQASKGGKQRTILPSYEVCDYSYNQQDPITLRTQQWYHIAWQKQLLSNWT